MFGDNLPRPVAGSPTSESQIPHLKQIPFADEVTQLAPVAWIQREVRGLSIRRMRVTVGVRSAERLSLDLEVAQLACVAFGEL